MAGRNSQQDQDAVVWQTSGLPLGQLGLDLRQPSDVRALSKLINARFADERNIERRNGYFAKSVRDSGGYPEFLDEDDDPISLPIEPTGWVYGHGQLLAQNALTHETDHLPAPGVARGTFNYGGSDVVWTGDRLLVLRDAGNALGGSAFWGDDETILKRGIPAYLPVQTEREPPDTIVGDYVETCLTETLCAVAAGSEDGLTVWLTTRDGLLIDKTELSDDETTHIRLFQSGSVLVCVWLEDDGSLSISHWTGVEWAESSLIDSDVETFDVALVSGGFHLLWRVADEMFIGKYSGKTTANVPYEFQTTVEDSMSDNVPDGAIAIAVSPVGHIAIAWKTDDSKLVARCWNSSLTTGDTPIELDSGANDWDCLTMTCRGLSISEGEKTTYPFVTYAGRAEDSYPRVYIYEWHNAATDVLIASNVRYNAAIASKAFTVGNEVFAWMRASNAGTNFLAAGVNVVQVCGYADREEAVERAFSEGQAHAMVTRDPLDEYAFSWARPYFTGQEYHRAGNVRLGDLQFLPSFCAVQYGKSCYLAGSAVRNWDGQELGDAGFQNYPIVSDVNTDTGGYMTEGDYLVRVYPVRYNRKGERFQGAALASIVTIDAGKTKATLTLRTLPDTNHEDVVFEVYRTEMNGTTFYLEGTVANDTGDDTVSFDIAISDADLIEKTADPHAAGVGQTSELTEVGPTGCSILAVFGDRLWAAGGQIPAGRVEFSKLKEPNEGAGFSDSTDYYTVDLTGRPITSLLGWGDTMVFFTAGPLYGLTGPGENNFGEGEFPAPQLTLPDGAITHLGTIGTQVGPVYWGVDGPRLLSSGYKVENISLPVRPLSKTLTPSGVQVDSARREVVWFTEEGPALLWNYAAGTSRWAKWNGLRVAGCSPAALVTTDGRLLIESADAYGDAGAPFAFGGATTELHGEDILQGSTQLRAIGIVGKYLGSHQLRVKIFYNGAASWAEEWTWQPETKTWLLSGEDLGDLTPAQIDALGTRDQSGNYATHKRTQRHECSHFRVEWSDINADRPTYQPHELELELGVRGGLARTSVATFGD